MVPCSVKSRYSVLGYDIQLPLEPLNVFLWQLHTHTHTDQVFDNNCFHSTAVLQKSFQPFLLFNIYCLCYQCWKLFLQFSFKIWVIINRGNGVLFIKHWSNMHYLDNWIIKNLNVHFLLPKPVAQTFELFLHESQN